MQICSKFTGGDPYGNVILKKFAWHICIGALLYFCWGFAEHPFRRTPLGSGLGFISFVLVEVINNTFCWLAFIIYRPEFADWSKTFLKVFFILWCIFWNNFPNACCNWSTYYILFQSLVKQMFFVTEETFPSDILQEKSFDLYPL